MIVKILTSFLTVFPGSLGVLSLKPVHPHIFLFSFFLLSTRAIMEQLSIQKLFGLKGEFYELPKSSKLILSSSYEHHPGFTTMVREQSFSGWWQWKSIPSPTWIWVIAFGHDDFRHDTRNYKMGKFPFSLTETMKQWYTCTIGITNSDRDDLKDRLCLIFFPISRIITMQMEVLDFEQMRRNLWVAGLGSLC